MKTSYVIGFVAICLLASCGGQETTPADRAKIESCWLGAGISSDLYKFLSIHQLGELQPGGVVSEAQAASFNQCMGSGA